MRGQAKQSSPVARQLALIVLLFSVIVACLVVLVDFEIGVLGAVRAYVNGEGFWSKGQKDAVHYLVRYEASHDERDFRAFRDAIAVPLGDRVARRELEQPAPNYARVREGFLAGRNHADDIDGMASLFRRFRHATEMDQAIHIWAAGDRSIGKLRRYGEALHEALGRTPVDAARARALLTKIDRVNARVTPLEDGFSRALGAGARRMRRLARVTTFGATACLLVVGFAGSWLILQRVRGGELALRESEERYRALFEDANDIVYTHDLHGRFLGMNKAGESVLGYTRQEILGLEIADVVAAEHWAAANRALEERAPHENITGYELVVVTKDGCRIPLEVNTRPILHEGRPVAIQGIARDVTARHRVEEERTKLLARERAARTEAELASRTKDEFLAMLSHELRTPLTAILAWARLLRGGKLDPSAQVRALEVIERNTKLQTALIDDLLDVSRIIAGKIRLDLGPVDSGAVVVAAVDMIRGAAEAKGIALELAIEPETGLVWGDRNRLLQVVTNLLSNAVKFTPSGGRVEVGLERDGDVACIQVCDTGVGIAPTFLPHVFERFRQADSTYTRRQGGLGLGLAIVRHLVELHGGTVAAESAGAGHGATFRVRLPLRMAEAEALREIAERSSDLPAPRLTGVAVLVVDDDADTRAALGAALEERGAAVTLAESAAEALAAIDAATPDVLLCDVAMPGENGFELIRTLRARDPARGGSIPAAALTAYASEEDERLALEAGFHRHLAKPVDPLDLAAAVAELAATTEPSAAPRRAHGQSA